jgi:carbonic anhydrase
MAVRELVSTAGPAGNERWAAFVEEGSLTKLQRLKTMNGWRCGSVEFRQSASSDTCLWVSATARLIAVPFRPSLWLPITRLWKPQFKRSSMKTLFAMMTVGLTLSCLASAQAWNHNPISPIGPLHWGTVTPSFATCGDSVTGEVGMKQSPINIPPGSVVVANFFAPLFEYKETPLKIENTGHYIEVPYDPNSRLDVGSQPTDIYQLVQFHFHAPSEHTINGVRYDAELHLVHTNAIGETAVIGVLLSSLPAGLPIPITPFALARLHSLIGMFPNYNGYSNNNRPVANQNGRTVLKSLNLP